MLSIISNFFAFFDIFGTQINFRFKSNSLLKSSFGGIISILILILMIVISVFLFVDLIQKNKQSMIESEIISSDYLDIKLNTVEDSLQKNETLFFFAFSIVNRTNNQRIQDFNKFMFLEINEIEKYANNTRKNVGYYSYDKCSNLYENDEFPNNQTFIRNWYCINSKKFRITGDFFSDLYRYIEIRLRFCNYTLNSNKDFCDNVDVIENKISQIQFQYLLLNSLIDPNKVNNENPIVNQYQIFTTLPNFKFRFSNDIYITKSVLKSHENIVLSSSTPKEYEFLEISKSLNRYQDLTDSFATIYIRSDNKYKLFRRSYKLIFSVLSELGGIFRVLFFIGAIFCIPVNLNILYTSLSNKIFNLISPEENIENETFDFYKRELNPYDPQSEMKVENITSLEAGMSIDLFKYDRLKFIDYKMTEIMIDVFTFGLINTELQKKKKSIFSYAFRKLDEKLNVKNVFDYTNKIKFIKLLLLGDYQLILKLLRKNIVIEHDHVKFDKKYDNFEKKENLPPRDYAIYKQMVFLKSIRAIRSKSIIDERIDCNLINTFEFDEDILKNYFVAHYHVFLKQKELSYK